MHLLALLVLLFVSLCFSEERPNILLVIADDLGWSDIGRHDPAILSPNIDRMAAEGIFLQNHYVSPICTPTRAALMTGRYPHRTGMDYPFFPDSVYGLPLTEVLLPQRLQESGYETHLVGKWHLGFSRHAYLPTRRGFNTHFGNHAQEIHYFNHTTFRQTRVVPGREVKNAVGIDFFRNGVPVNLQGEYSTTLYGDETVKLIQEQNASVPFFISLAFNTIHAPLMAPDEYLSQCLHLPAGNRRLICGMIKSMDDEMGKIEAALKDTGAYNNTLIIFMSDNGGDLIYNSNNAPYLGTKADSYEGAVKSFSFLSGGFLEKQATRIGYTNEVRISAVDWLPTLIKLAGGTPSATPLPLDGFDMWGALVLDQPSPRNELLLVYDRVGFPGGRKALIRDNMKYMINPTNPANFVADGKPFPRVFLFNLTADPFETTNLATVNPNLTSFLAQRVEAYGTGLFFRTFIFDTVNSDPARFGGYWQPWLTDDFHFDSCSQNWGCETPCYFNAVQLIPYFELNRPCPANDYIGPVGAGLQIRNSYGVGSCFWTNQLVCACNASSCLNGGTCSSQGGQARCACPFGYSGAKCEIVIDFCTSNPCLNGGICQKIPTNYTCDCLNTAFYGNNCEIPALPVQFSIQTMIGQSSATTGNITVSLIGSQGEYGPLLLSRGFAAGNTTSLTLYTKPIGSLYAIRLENSNADGWGLAFASVTLEGSQYLFGENQLIRNDTSVLLEAPLQIKVKTSNSSCLNFAVTVSATLNDTTGKAANFLLGRNFVKDSIVTTSVPFINLGSLVSLTLKVLTLDKWVFDTIEITKRGITLVFHGNGVKLNIFNSPKTFYP